MISQYSDPRDIDREFWNDKAKALYWLKKHTNRKAVEWQLMEDGYDVMDGKADYRFSEPIFYTSPQTGNRWLLYISARRDENGDVRLMYRSILYYFTEKYMTIMLAITTFEENDDGERRNMVNGVNVYTAHLFQRMEERAGINMSDRVKAMRNFSEFVGTGWSDTRPARKGEKHEQIMMRLPGSWLRGHVIDVGGRVVTIYRTFYTDRSMTPQQRRDVKSFRKFADEKMTAIQSPDKERSKGTAQFEPDNEQKNEGETIAKDLVKHLINKDMEFEGRITRVLPVRSGTSQNGNEWKRLPFVFAYYENGEQRWEDKVLLETWDTNLMAQIGQYCEKGQDGKAVIENGCVKLNTLDIKCKCGFSHSVRDVTKKDGSGTVTMNELRCYKLEITTAANAPGTVAQPQQPQQSQAPFPPQTEGGHDDLPF